MNKSLRFLIVFTGAFLLIALGTINAQIQETPLPSPRIIKHQGLPAPGLLPTSPFYFVKRIFENLGTLLTFGTANKAVRHFELATKRLAEAETLATQGKFEEAKPIFENYEKELEKTQNYLEKAELQGKEMSKLAERILKILPILTPAGDESRQAEETNQEVKEKTPPQAQRGLPKVEENLQKTAQKILLKKQAEQAIQTLQALSQYKGSDKLGQCDSFSSRVISEDIQDTKALGFGWARPIGDVFAQETIEKQKGSYDFSVPDATVKKLQSAGLKIFGTLFPSGMPKIPQSADLASFENYVKAVVDRYNGDGKNDMPGLTAKITYWQVGIEPFCSSPGTNCYKTFFELVKTAYQAAKSVDASLMLSPGGPAPIFGPDGKEDKMASGLFGYFFGNGGANYMDFFNFHYLVGAKNHEIKKYIDYWKRYVPGDKEIWLSETGSRDVGDRFTISSNAQEEANWVKKHLNDSFQNGVTKVFWCRAEHSYSEMPEVVKVLQEFAKQTGGNPLGSITKRQTQQIPRQSGQQQQPDGMMPPGGTTPGGQQQMPGGGIQQPGGMMPQPGSGTQPDGGFQQPGGGMMQQPSGGFQPPGGGFQQPGGTGPGGYCGDNQCDSIEQQTGGCPQDCR